MLNTVKSPTFHTFLHPFSNVVYTNFNGCCVTREGVHTSVSARARLRIRAEPRAEPVLDGLPIYIIHFSHTQILIGLEKMFVCVFSEILRSCTRKRNQNKLSNLSGLII